jgi:adenine phosphoribosyltransferase
MDIERIKGAITAIPDFPLPGILFRDIFPIFQKPELFELVITHLLNHIVTRHQKVDVIVGLDARGFLFGPTLACRLGAAFVPVRKRGKLPGKCVQVTYKKEYGEVCAAIAGPSWR